MKHLIKVIIENTHIVDKNETDNDVIVVLLTRKEIGTFTPLERLCVESVSIFYPDHMKYGYYITEKINAELCRIENNCGICEIFDEDNIAIQVNDTLKYFIDNFDSLPVDYLKNIETREVMNSIHRRTINDYYITSCELLDENGAGEVRANLVLKKY